MLLLSPQPAVVTEFISPPLKKEGTDLLFKNIRPVSNLAYFSKLTETAVAIQTQSHMSQHGFYPVLQSAYRKYHSTETALLKVHNDYLTWTSNMTLCLCYWISALRLIP